MRLLFVGIALICGSSAVFAGIEEDFDLTKIQLYYEEIAKFVPTNLDGFK